MWLYMFHLLLGHHGIFSLSPIFLLSVLGMAYPKLADTTPRASLKCLLYLAGLISVIVFLFYTVYVYHALQTSNYGGWTSGPRWFFWMIPLWLMSMLPVADRLAGSRWGRGLGYVLLGLSALSVAYPAWNPWRHPWIYNWMQDLGWIRY
jgi:hypothetical protein